MPEIPIHETSVRAVVPLEGQGSLLLAGLPGLRISFNGEAYFDPEHAALTFEYMESAGVGMILLLMEDFELPPKARALIDEMAKSHKIMPKWLPIVDFGAPDAAFEKKWKSGRSVRFQCLNTGQSIAVTCLYGAGRSGMMAAAIAVEAGVELKQSLRYVRQHYAEAVGSQEQERWVLSGAYLE